MDVRSGEEFRISVVIPVYNAEPFVRRAVESALAQPQVIEVILIEDCSPDNALEVCRRLTREFEKVKLFRHPGGANRGAGASRNLGIRNAVGEFVAFLDADDVFCHGRFDVTEKILKEDQTVMGVYEPVGVSLEDEVGARQFSTMTHRSLAQAAGHITQLRATNSSIVYEHLIRGNRGFFNTSGVTLRRSVLTGEFFFNEALRLHQDTELWIRISYKFKLVAGASAPVSLRGVHQHNRIVKQNLESRYLYYNTLLEYFRNLQIPYKLKLFLFRAVVRNNPARKHVGSDYRILKLLELVKCIILEYKKFPLR